LPVKAAIKQSKWKETKMGQIAAHSYQLSAENVMMPFGEVLEVADKLSLNE